MVADFKGVMLLALGATAALIDPEGSRACGDLINLSISHIMRTCIINEKRVSIV